MVTPTSGEPEEQSEPREAQQHHRESDQTRSTKAPPRQGGRHRRATRRPRYSAQQVGDLITFVPRVFRIADGVGQHEAPIKEWIHTQIGAAGQIVDAVLSFLS